MLHLIIAAADRSKVPFYIAGAVLALWAVSLATYGLRNPDFPRGPAGQRGVMAISFLLAAIAIGTAAYVK